jgi:hypothetical protein
MMMLLSWLSFAGPEAMVCALRAIGIAKPPAGLVRSIRLEFWRARG